MKVGRPVRWQGAVGVAARLMVTLLQVIADIASIIAAVGIDGDIGEHRRDRSPPPPQTAPLPSSPFRAGSMKTGFSSG